MNYLRDLRLYINGAEYFYLYGIKTDGLVIGLNPKDESRHVKVRGNKSYEGHEAEPSSYDEVAGWLTRHEHEMLPRLKTMAAKDKRVSKHQRYLKELTEEAASRYDHQIMEAAKDIIIESRLTEVDLKELARMLNSKLFASKLSRNMLIELVLQPNIEDLEAAAWLNRTSEPKNENQ